MADKTKIQWADATINPVIGCSKISTGCQNCYAEKQARRLATFPHTKERYAGLTEVGKWTGVTRLVESELEKPQKWRKPRRIFVSSMGDLFHESVPFEWVARVLFSFFGEGALAPNPAHTCILLTKRAHRMREFFCEWLPSQTEHEDPEVMSMALWWKHEGQHPRLLLGVTVENQRCADERIPELLEIPGRHWLSVEPMLGAIDIDPPHCDVHQRDFDFFMDNGTIRCCECAADGYIGEAEYGHWLDKIDWVVAGCESGPNRRGTKVDWLRYLRDRCRFAGVAFLLKQMEIDGKVVSRPELDGQQWLEDGGCAGCSTMLGFETYVIDGGEDRFCKDCFDRLVKVRDSRIENSR